MKLYIGLILGVLLGLVAGWFIFPKIAGRKTSEIESEAKPREEKREQAVKLDKEQQKLAGIQLAQPKLVHVSPELKAYGRILDPSVFTALALEIQSAQASLHASKLEYERLKNLFAQNQNASARALETAEATMKRDQVALDTGESKLGLELGPDVSQKTNLNNMLGQVSKLNWALARVNIPGGSVAPVPNVAAVAAVFNPTNRFSAEVLGLSTYAEPQTPGQGFLLLIKTNQFSPNTPIIAWFPVSGKEVSGVSIPESALLLESGETIVFVSSGEDIFKSVAVEVFRANEQGVIVTNGLSETNQVVITGAQQLHSEKTKGTAED